MMKYIATFYSHYGAIQYRKNCEKMDLEAVVMPVPRDLSSSCGTVCASRQKGNSWSETKKWNRSSGSKIQDMCVSIMQMKNKNIKRSFRASLFLT